MFPTRFSLAEIIVLVRAGTAGAGGMPPPASTRIPARLKHDIVPEHSLSVRFHEFVTKVLVWGSASDIVSFVCIRRVCFL